jgi:hypothetical protein
MLRSAYLSACAPFQIWMRGFAVSKGRIKRGRNSNGEAAALPVANPSPMRITSDPMAAADPRAARGMEIDASILAGLHAPELLEAGPALQERRTSFMMPTTFRTPASVRLISLENCKAGFESLLTVF